ncbi:MAG: hypothetical protein WB974_19650 [Acidobacteriaceae bacterium]
MVNGVPCPECGGSSRRVVPSRWGGLRKRLHRFADSAAVPAGTVVRWSASLPGVAGAAAVSYGVAAVVHGVFGQVPELGAGLIVAGVFGLLADRRL